MPASERVSALGVSDNWRAELALDLRRRGDRTVLANRRQRGPLVVQRPFYPEGEVCHLYLLHPPGGVVGGDELQIDVDADEGSAALLTTPGATKFYRSSGALASQRVNLRVRRNATLEWLPQETIGFPGARVAARMQVELEVGAHFVGWDTVCLGRPAIGEAFALGWFDSRIEVRRGGVPLLHERLSIDGVRGLSRASGLRGWPVTATFWATDVTEALLHHARAGLPNPENVRVGLTLLGDFLVARYVGDSTAEARGIFIKLWRLIRAEALGRAACLPRIWAT
ncbi:MAG: urease accessory protein UreD [Thiotrichales bacterium]